ncbi:hypothetical protein KY331_00650 [Candidatus Woesearchaeota archaeon]|nr:hypothetical protein [Candidatus Woesearchaeota archaeon]
MVVAKKAGKKVRKKQWFQIVAPKLFNNQPIGEVFLYDAADAVGRYVNVNLMNLTRDVRRQNIKIKFVINRVSDNIAHTDIAGYEMIPASIKRMVRRGKSKIEISLVVETADRKKVRIKPILITRFLVKSSVSIGLRKKAEEIIDKNFRKTPYAALVQEIVAHKFQSNLKRSLSKIYPLRVCEIKNMSIEKEAKAKGLSAEIIKKEIEAKEVKEKAEEKEKIKKEEKTEEKKPKKEVKAEEEKKEEAKEKKPEETLPASKKVEEKGGKEEKEKQEKKEEPKPEEKKVEEKEE